MPTEEKKNYSFGSASYITENDELAKNKLHKKTINAPFEKTNKNHAQRLFPFLKWAGGKRWLVEKHSDLLNVEHDRYIEPFLGSGAVFFSLHPTSSILCDKNERLIETYNAIKHEWEKVMNLLKVHHSNHAPDYYYQIRLKHMPTPETRAAQFIYLNRTCWNGLYRVNRQGKFNVPIGTKKNVILSTDDFEKTSIHLKNAELVSGDFEIVLEKSKKGDFIFIDPPYTIKHNHNGFIKYNENIFSWEDQTRLRDAVECAASRGAKILVTNACHDSIKSLYENIGEIIILNRASIIAGKSSARGRFEEILIKCY